MSRKISRIAMVLLLLVVTTITGSARNTMIRTKVPARPKGQTDMVQFAADPIETVRIGFVGLGMRGGGSVGTMIYVDGVKVVALCDLREERVKACQKILLGAGLPAAAEYFGEEESWKKLCERDDIDLVYVATDWQHHALVAKYAMEHGKHVAIEVPAALTMKDIWDLINTSERTRKHCMQLENCVYDFFELNSLYMAQKGLFGEILHCEGAYLHNLDPFWDRYYNDWRLQYNKEHRGDVYPTHGLGPVCQVLNIHRGDKLDYLVAMDTKAVCGKEYYTKHRKDADADGWKSGDHSTTMIRTHNGKSILIEHDVVTPHPYSRMYQLQGTRGYANKYLKEGIMVDRSMIRDLVSEEPDLKGISVEKLDAHDFLPENVYKAVQKRYQHPLLKDIEEKARKVGGHGGMDYIMMYRLIYCLRNGLPLDMDVYDLAEWCCLCELTGISMDHGCAPVEIPDFTRGAWNRVDGYHHAGIEE